jgi:2-polyprenyl-3-methyl-5-hydroxy-6-metoxy-1,4-benzoquinol methylase
MSRVEAFYNDFSPKFVEDFVYGNERVKRQFEFFSAAIPADTKRVLVIGCGSGQGAHFIATKVARQAKVLGVDISAQNLQLAAALFADQRIEYRRMDVTQEAPEGQWDIIVLPDVYEHIPREAHHSLHSKLDGLLNPKGKILFTLPSPGYQKHLHATGQGLQVVDEIITLEDLVAFAHNVGGTLTYFRLISIWLANDYLHAMIERDAEQMREIAPADDLPVKGLPRKSLGTRGRDFLLHRLRLKHLPPFWRQWQARKRLSGNLRARVE